MFQVTSVWYNISYIKKPHEPVSQNADFVRIISCTCVLLEWNKIYVLISFNTLYLTFLNIVILAKIAHGAEALI